MKSVTERIAEELGVEEWRVKAAARLLDEGTTVPFIARYRKEATGGLDDTQLRALEKRLAYLRELEERRATILATIEEQGKLTPELRRAILAAETRTALEDLYLPYRPKRRTKAEIARGAGLAPLAQKLRENPALVPETEAAAFVDPARGVPDAKSALDGARQILMENLAEDAVLVGTLRDLLWERGLLTSKVLRGKERDGQKFSDYFDKSEPIRSVPSHRALAVFRGRNEGILGLAIELDEDADLGRGKPGPAPRRERSTAERTLARGAGLQQMGRAADAWLAETVHLAWRDRLAPRLEADLFKRLGERAEEEAIRVFAGNLRDLLLAAPAGPRVTMGLDPGLRTGVKVAVVDRTGRLLDTATVYPHPPASRWDESLEQLAALAERHGVELIGIGNGTASRETDRLAGELVRRRPDPRPSKVVVSEAGASVYSASELAAREFPELDVSLRGAVSIARRLQDPLAELVKIEPQAIGVGQYQHDVAAHDLAAALDAVVEDCVNAVGVDVNTASAPLLARVAGLGASLAANVVAHRDEHGPFRDRRELRRVARLGAKAFEQAAGFLRITSGENPLDASAVHPEAYPVVEAILKRTGRRIGQVIGDAGFLRGLRPADFTTDAFGEPTVRDILSELEKPGRDPRPEFRTAAFREGVESLADLSAGMLLEGVVTNVTSFGAFVDVGVHQDGLVHISAMADRFVRDPREVVKAGDVVRVRVVGVEPERRRIALSMKL